MVTEKQNNARVSSLWGNGYGGRELSKGRDVSGKYTVGEVFYNEGNWWVVGNNRMAEDSER